LERGRWAVIKVRYSLISIKHNGGGEILLLVEGEEERKSNIRAETLIVCRKGGRDIKEVVLYPTERVPSRELV